MIDVVLITGFLGSGKTTFLNQLLPRLRDRYQRLAVVMNEFGSVGIDGRLVNGHDYLTELNKGSIFCVCIRDDFLQEMARLAEKVAPDVVVIEATGVADPLEMGDFLSFPQLRDSFRLRRIVTLIDAINFPKVACTLKAARTQAQAGDILIITKEDLADEKQLFKVTALLDEINPQAPRLLTSYCQLSEKEWQVVLSWKDDVVAPGESSMHHTGAGLNSKKRQAGLPRRPARDPVTTFTLEINTLNSEAEARALARYFPKNVLRAKGLIEIGRKIYLFQYVPGRTEITPAQAETGNVGQIVVVGERLKAEQLSPGGVPVAWKVVQ